MQFILIIFKLRSGCCMKHDVNVAVEIFHPQICRVICILFFDIANNNFNITTVIINIAMDHPIKIFYSTRGR